MNHSINAIFRMKVPNSSGAYMLPSNAITVVWYEEKPQEQSPPEVARKVHKRRVKNAYLPQSPVHSEKLLRKN